MTGTGLTNYTLDGRSQVVEVLVASRSFARNIVG